MMFVNIKLFKIKSLKKKKKGKIPDQYRFQEKENKVHLLMERQACV